MVLQACTQFCEKITDMPGIHVKVELLNNCQYIINNGNMITVTLRSTNVGEG